MEKTKIMNKSRELVIFLAFVVTLVSIGATIGDQSSRQGSLNKTASTFGLFNINNLTIPFDNKGVIADVNVPGVGAYGKFGGHTFLFSSGFFISGLHNGDLFGNGVLTASRISDYVAGPAGSLASDAKNRVYVVSVQDPAFGKSWQDWKTAVSIGADFYDGDGDGVYNPVDKNANGTWDSDEDRPDLIGDWTGWTVFNDGLPKAQRRWTNVDPKGIEIHQSIFGFSSRGVVGNMMFLRYRIVNTGRVADRFDSVFFSVAADPDLGNYNDDLVGCDTVLSAGYVYNDGDDDNYGPNAPAFLIDFFQGPVAFVPGVSFIDNNGNGLYDAGETALDTAWDVKGKFLGKEAIIGAKNLPLTSFSQYMQSHPTHGDPDNIFELRNYIKGGRGKNGDLLNVCTWGFGNGASLPNCANIDPKFMYSGDPETRTGWLNTTPIDQRQMSNTGPFALEKGKPIDIVAVYIAGRGTNPLNSVTVAKDYSRTAQLVFDNNFPSPPPPPPVNVALTTGANFIDLDWPTADLIKYRARDTVLDVDRRFQGFFVTQYLTNAKTSSIQGVEAAKIVAHYQIHNHVRGVFQRKGNGGIDLVIEDLASEFKLDSLLYSNPSTGRIKVRLNRDAFTATPFIKGRDYYFTVTAYTLNHSVIQNRATNTYGPVGEYIDMTGAGIDYYESPIYPITFGENLFTPALAPTPSTQTAGKSKGNVKLLVADKSALTGDEYVVEFFPDTTAIPYAPFWRLRNVTRGTTLIDSSKVYDFDTTSYSGKVFQGFIPKVEPQLPVYPTNNHVQIQYISPNPRWFSDFSDPGGLGVFYAGRDLEQQPAGGLPTAVNLNLKSNVITADRLRTIEIRFGTPGKAYRFLRGFKGSGISRRATVVYAGVVTAADTTRNAFGGGTVGKLGEGFVDVPFTAWVKDTVFGEERQLEVAFIEHSVVSRGRPDGIWDTDTALLNTQEYIIVFDSPYSATPTNKIITGSGSTNWSDIRGYINNDATLTPFQVRTARSPWFNALYIVGLQQRTSTSYPTAGDILRIPMRVYPYTDLDKFTFRTLAQGQISEAQEREIFENVNVFPNPLFAFNPATSFDATANPDDPFVTFTNLPTEVTIKIYTLGGQLIRTLNESDKIGGVNSPFLRWDIENEAGLRAASGMYLAIVSSPKYGEKILKLAIIMPQKQLPRF